ncbi:acyl-CoA dehydrogenase [Robbsia sp. Bb-Pol-6]|uniref:Acyl-CoA dehydrogenase n=1 Tax=Robbsia betulipollinis TaxID=2981849 RepID=A0ABT3ZQD5_9BURK|nr:acyl-CoA dehydrogenase [Robbsia betulipollinis]MCY0388627.1 acyl-CoA dehydrogenase [Robbsia betulipollinis]
MGYKAPVEDMLFLMRELEDLDGLAQLPGYEEATPDTVAAILAESATFCEQVLAPLNVVGDREPPVWQAGEVTTTPGFAAAYRQFRDAGWQGLPHPVEYGGQGLPRLLAAACNEMRNAANLSFALCPLLSDGAIDALLIAGSPAQRARYLPRLVSGEWTGTMNLTEPQAGSDLAQVRTRAVPDGESRYRVFGTKIFITYGEHDFAANIVHLVLARLPDAPPGVKGLSLFVVPKFVVDAEGRPGARNDLHCVSIEHKLGIHGSPTAVLQFGERDGALGELLGEPNRGLETMFIMMNAARFGVGVQGVAIADRACQAARAYALERVQGRPATAQGTIGPARVAGEDGGAGHPGAGHPGAGHPEARTIVAHPDVRRMLATMRALTEGARALAFHCAAANDLAHRAPGDDVRRRMAALCDYLVPVVKGWATEMSVEVASLAVQVHGGMGFIEDTGVAQFYRDARILPIYEGTTAIQANDLVGRKTVRDGGAVARSLIGEIDATLAALRRAPSAGVRDAAAVSLASIATQLQAGRDAFAAVVAFIVERAEADPAAVYAGSVPYLKLAGIVLSGWQLARAALVVCQVPGDGVNENAGEGSGVATVPGAVPEPARFAVVKLATVRFFAEQILPQAEALRVAIVSARGGEGVWGLADELC